MGRPERTRPRLSPRLLGVVARMDAERHEKATRRRLRRAQQRQRNAARASGLRDVASWLPLDAVPEAFRAQVVAAGERGTEPWLPLEQVPSEFHERIRAVWNLDYDADVWTPRRAERADRIRDRIERGFVWQGGAIGGTTESDGYYVGPLTYQGLKSDEHPILKVFSSKTRRVGGLRVGRRKSDAERPEAKILGLDEPYVDFNGVMRGVIRGDLDGVWPSMAAFRADLYDCLPVAAWPAFAVGLIGPNGEVVRPQVYWILEDSVCWTEKGRRSPKALMKAVERGLCAALIPMGADPGALSRPMHGKNPLSPLWHTEILSGDVADLGEIRELVDLNVDVADLTRDAAEARVPDGVELADGVRVSSNSLFTALQAVAWELIEPHKDAGDFDQFFAELTARAYEIGHRRSGRQVRAVAANVAEYAWAKWNPEKRQADRPGRGRLRDDVRGLSLAERQAAGGKDSAARVRQGSLDAARAAYEAILAEGSRPTQAAVQARSGLGIATVKRLWSDLRALVGEGITRCTVKGSAAGGGGGDRGDTALGRARVRSAAAPRPARPASYPLPLPHGSPPGRGGG